jgi:hypothetical protein
LTGIAKAVIIAVKRAELLTGALLAAVKNPSKRIKA